MSRGSKCILEPFCATRSALLLLLLLLIRCRGLNICAGRGVYCGQQRGFVFKMAPWHASPLLLCPRMFSVSSASSSPTLAARHSQHVVLGRINVYVYVTQMSFV